METQTNRQQAIHVDAVDVAKMVRKELKAAFPEIKFKVKTSRYSGGSSIAVKWENGPTKKMVDAIVGHFRGKTFDGMTDMASYHDTEVDGVLYHFGNGYIFTGREVDSDLKSLIINNIALNFSDIPESTTVDNWHSLPHDQYTIINKLIDNANFLDMTTRFHHFDLSYWNIEDGEYVKVEREIEEVEPAVEIITGPSSLSGEYTVEHVDLMIDDVKWPHTCGNGDISLYYQDIRSGDFNTKPIHVTKIVRMNEDDFGFFCQNLIDGFDEVDGTGGTDSHYPLPLEYQGMNFFNAPEDIQEAFHAEAFVSDGVAVVSPLGETIYVDAQGRSYAKYVGIGKHIDVIIASMAEHVKAEPDVIELVPEETPAEKPKAAPVADAQPSEFSFSFSFSGAIA